VRASRLLAIIAVAAGAIGLTPGIAAAAQATTYCKGALPAGNYRYVVVPPDQACFADHTGVHISHGLLVRPGATFVLGDEGDPQDPSLTTLAGGVVSNQAANVQIHFATITDGLTLVGGSGPFYEHSAFCDPTEGCITWQTIEDSNITGNVTITDYNGFWQGFFRNQVNGSMQFNRNHVVDKDGNELQSNVITGDLRCNKNKPMPQQGDSGGSTNQVGGQATLECARISEPLV